MSISMLLSVSFKNKKRATIESKKDDEETKKHRETIVEAVAVAVSLAVWP